MLGFFAVKDDLTVSLVELGMIGAALNDRFLADDSYVHLTGRSTKKY